MTVMTVGRSVQPVSADTGLSKGTHHVSQRQRRTHRPAGPSRPDPTAVTPGNILAAAFRAWTVQRGGFVTLTLSTLPMDSVRNGFVSVATVVA